MHYLQFFSTTQVISIALLGLVLGSFINVVICRLPIMLGIVETHQHPDRLNLVWPPSQCMACGQRIRWWENVPLLSFWYLRGRSVCCQSPISWRYPAVELSGCLLALFAFSVSGISVQGLLLLAVSLGLLALFWIDLDHCLLPDVLTLSILGLGILASFLGYGQAIFSDAVCGAFVGCGSLWGIRDIFQKLTGKEGLGFGDVKLLGAIGAWAGWQHLPDVILIASLLTLTVAVAQISRGRMQRDAQIPFGPGLVIGALFVLLT
ncbi:MAG: hypothetical protein RIR18_574 [Pseudomonadota bacterium]|jgi:leader peptidase (prepilin peptidase)/N-methyltransferase